MEIFNEFPSLRLLAVLGFLLLLVVVIYLAKPTKQTVSPPRPMSRSPYPASSKVPSPAPSPRSGRGVIEGVLTEGKRPKTEA